MTENIQTTSFVHQLTIAMGLMALTSLAHRGVCELMSTSSKKKLNFCDLVAYKNIDLQGQVLYRELWNNLIPTLRKHQVILWDYDGEKQRPPNGDMPIKDNYIYLVDTGPSGLALLATYLPPDGLSHAARSTNALPRDIFLRIIAAGTQGRMHLGILRDLCVRPDILYSNNHILPMIQEISVGDFTIGVFPRTLYTLLDAVVHSRVSGDKTSFEDILYLLLQALEGIHHIHCKGVAHCDMFLDNLAIEWIPQSLVKASTTSRPRVYLINFDKAIQFTQESQPSERLVHDRPLPAVTTVYYRADAPELSQKGPYCPFRLDMWQFGYFLQKYYMTTIPEIDQLWADLVTPKPEERPTALEAMNRLNEFISSTTRSSLQIGFA
uniref:Protein kinase domain-containing protein n=1 Tax=Psilocybe cubensis TaxID=181762 RepID=A0A8H8CGU5_PSICU